ncbi:MAG TPA: choice-of-anchor D domain-containing protein, partial [Rhodanobacteraceae bacterium]|nr:choice-of-anchor D domain-containing protein [Rhodanobacteraceae bacterium]
FVLLPYDVDGAGPLPEKLAVGGTFLVTGGVANRRLALYGPDAPLGNLSVTPSTIDFGNAQLPGAVVGPTEVTLFASGNAPVSISAVDDATTPFHRAGGDCPQAPFQLAAGDACTMSFVFVPIAPGEFSQTIAVQNDGASATSFTLRGVGVAPPPVITVDPASLDLELAAGDTTTRDITIGNDGGSPLDWHVAAGYAGAAVLRPTHGASLPRTRPLPANAALARIAGTHAGASFHAPRPDAAGDRVVLTESTSMDVVAGTSIACSNAQTGFTSENHFLRTFTLGDFGIDHDFEVVSVRFGIESLSVDTTVTVNLYTLTGDFVYENMQLIGSAPASLAVQAGTLVDVPVAATVPAGATLVVEIVVPDLEAAGSGWFYPGANSAGESAPSYLAAPGCNVDEPAPMASFGRPDVHLVMAVTGSDPVDCSVPAWLGLDPASGTVAPGDAGVLAASVDATGLAGGDYAANVCLASNDPVPLLTIVPVHLHVLGDNDVLAASPDAVDYGTVPAGVRAGPAMIALVNTGATPAAISAVDAAIAPFVQDGGDCPAVPFTLAGGASCTLGYTFAPTVVGDYATTLHVASDVGNASFTLTGTGIAGAPSQLALLGGSGQSAMAGAAFALPLAVQVRDAWNNPVPNIEVAFAAPGSGASAVLSAGAATTDANGYASVTATANAIAGGYSVAASGGLGAPVAFALTNTAAVVDVAAAIVADRDYVRAGEMLDYVVTLHNTGSIATTDAAIASTLSPLLDTGAATWVCLGPGASGCTASGTGDLAESGLALAPGGSVSYLVSAPVRVDADADDVVTSVHASLTGDGNPGDDGASASTTLVILRDGFEPYGDGADRALVARDERLSTTTSVDFAWPSAGPGPVDVVLTADAADGSGFRIEQLNDGLVNRVRLVARDRAGDERAIAWAPIVTGEAVHLTLVEGDGAQASSVVVLAANARLELPVATAAGYRLASAPALTLENPPEEQP